MSEQQSTNNYFKNDLQLILGLLQSVTKKEIKRHKVYLMETLMEGIKEANKKTGKKILQLTIIFDLDQLSMTDLMYKPGILSN